MSAITNSIKCGSKTHLIFGSECCGKTTTFKKIIQENIRRDEDKYFIEEYDGRETVVTPDDICLGSYIIVYIDD